MRTFLVPTMVVGNVETEMEEITCAECGETLARPDRYEDIPDGMETGHEHLSQTGHVPFSLPRIAACDHCEYVWCYTGDKDNTSCPVCEYKTTVNPEVDVEIRAVSID